MTTVEYGHGLRVEWTQHEVACILRARVRRMAEADLGLPNDRASRAAYYRQNPELEDKVEVRVESMLEAASSVGPPTSHRERYGS